MDCCTFRKQLEKQDLEVIDAAGKVLNDELRQILVKSRNPHAKAAVAQIDDLADEYDKWVDLRVRQRMEREA